MRRVIVVTMLAAVTLLTACSGQRDRAAAVLAAGLPIDFYRDAAARGESVYRIDSDESLVTIYVYRDGPLAGMGHDHVVASRDLRGYALWPDDAAAARADLRMPIATASVDDAELRTAAGFESVPSADDIAGTYANMLASVDADAFPDIGLRVTLLRPPPEPRVNVDVSWHGVTRSFDVPVSLVVDADRLEATGSLGIRQTDFGITPHSVFGGALSVADRLNVSFRLRATRVTELAVDIGQGTAMLCCREHDRG